MKLSRLSELLKAAGIHFESVVERDGELYIIGTPPESQAAADAVLSAFDPSPEADAVWAENQFPERRNLRQAATQALADIDTYLSIASPNNAQVVAQVRRLSQYTKAVIKRLVQID